MYDETTSCASGASASSCGTLVGVLLVALVGGAALRTVLPWGTAIVVSVGVTAV